MWLTLSQSVWTAGVNSNSDCSGKVLRTKHQTKAEMDQN